MTGAEYQIVEKRGIVVRSIDEAEASQKMNGVRVRAEWFDRMICVSKIMGTPCGARGHNPLEGLATGHRVCQRTSQYAFV
jgi:hypothetical protein